MAWNPYFPANYAPVYNPYPQNVQNAPNGVPSAYQPQGGNYTQPQPQAQSGASNGLKWVQGVEGAKAHPVPAGATVMLMDSESERFFIKSSDASGMPLPLRVFEYKEVTENASQPSMAASGVEYVTHKEFDELKKSVEALTERKVAKLTDE